MCFAQNDEKKEGDVQQKNEIADLEYMTSFHPRGKP